MFSAGLVAFQFETGGRRERFERVAMSAGAGALVLVGRVLFAVFFARSAWGHYRRQPMMIGAARSARLPLPYLAGWPSALWLGAGSLLLAVGIWPDLGALMLGAFVIPAALYFHRFWTFEDLGQRQTQAGSFFRNAALLGASLAMFGLLATIGSGLRFSVTRPLFRF
jgi:putative oxidoreductase